MSEATTVSAPNGGADFKPVSEGLHVGVCVDVLNKWQQPIPERFRRPGGPTTEWKTRIVWEVPEERDDKGRPMIVGMIYTASLHEKANLRHMLEAWRGKRFTDEQVKGFDLEAVLGKACQIQVVHVERNGNTYANVKTVVPMPKGVEHPKPSGHYIRVKDRKTDGPEPEADGEYHATDDDIPF